RANAADVPNIGVAAYHPLGADAVFCGDRGRAIDAMTVAFEHFLPTQDDLAGIIAIGGSGGTTLAAPAIRTLPLGTPKMIVSTMRSGNIAGDVGQSDIIMMYPVADLAGLNRITRPVLANAARAMTGMVKGNTRQAPEAVDK